MDRATQATLESLAKSGLIAITTAAARLLHPLSPAAAEPAPLSPEIRQRIDELRAKATHQIKIARALFSGDLIDEAVGPFRVALHASVCVLALGRHWSAPTDLAGCNRSPWSALVPPNLRKLIEEKQSALSAADFSVLADLLAK